MLGGPHLTIMPLESLAAPHDAYVDYVFKGEAEYSFLELVNTLEAGKLPGVIPGIHFRRDGEIVSSPESPMIPDLDALPFPAHDLFKIDRYTNLQPLTDGWDPNARSFTILTSRGCPYKCTFCSKPVTGDTWRARSVESVVQEWKWLVKGLGATEIGVTDDIWNLKLPRAKELCRRLVEEGLNTVPWVTVHGMKANHGDLELYQLMKAAGCKRVGFGVENGDPDMLRNVIRKGQTIDMVREAFANAKAAKLQTMGFFIYGMPGDTEETMEKTIQIGVGTGSQAGQFPAGRALPRHRHVRHDPGRRRGLCRHLVRLRHPRGEGPLHHERGLRSRPGVAQVARRLPSLLSLSPRARVGEDDVQGELDQSAQHRRPGQALLHRQQLMVLLHR